VRQFRLCLRKGCLRPVALGLLVISKRKPIKDPGRDWTAKFSRFETIARETKRRGFKFVGPRIAYAGMRATLADAPTSASRKRTSVSERLGWIILAQIPMRPRSL
jgi:hypothetical protein